MVEDLTNPWERGWNRIGPENQVGGGGYGWGGGGLKAFEMEVM